MTDILKRSWAEIDLDALRENVEGIKSYITPGCKLCAVVKADAYGHGDQVCAAEMDRHGADSFAVSNLEEALSLRKAGIGKPILILGVTPPEYAETLAQNGIAQTVFSPEYLTALRKEASRKNVRVQAHLKIDTGMNRIGFDGFDPAVCATEIERAARCPELDCEGIFTHFASADEDSPDAEAFTRAQFQRFQTLLGLLEEMGIRFNLRHCCNSAAALRYPEMHLDMVRPGVILYGMLPSSCCEGKVPLRPVMSLRSALSMVKEIPAGRAVSYGRKFVTSGPTRIATVPIGYADGYPRALSGRGRMLVHGKNAPVVGRVCMDQLMLDVSGVPEARAGDPATVIGTDGSGSISAEDLANAAGTINYEITCLVGKRVPRIYLREGSPCAVTKYLPNNS